MNINCRNLLESFPDAVLIIDLKGHIQLLNSAAESIFGYSAKELQDQHVNQLLPSDKRKKHLAQISSFIQNPSPRIMGSRMDISATNREGEPFPVDIMLNNIELDNQKHIICVVRDVTSIKKMSDKLERALKRESKLARHDPLTRVANRRLFDEHLKTMFHLSKRVDFVFTLVLIDIDDFKSVNDRFGHTVGDEVLIKTAEKLKSCTRKSDLVSRFGGDEFAIVLEHSKSNKIESVISKMHRVLKELYHDFEWPVSASIGAICCDEHPSSSEIIFKLADQTLYDIKKTGKNTFKLHYLSQLTKT